MWNFAQLINMAFCCMETSGPVKAIANPFCPGCVAEGGLQIVFALLMKAEPHFSAAAQRVSVFTSLESYLMADIQKRICRCRLHMAMRQCHVKSKIL